MKRISFIICLCVMACTAKAQYAANMLSLRVGAGLATSYNYNVGLAGGFEYTRGFGERIALGFNLMYQSYNLYYNNQAPLGAAGTSVQLSSSYVFFAPKVDLCEGRGGHVHFYLCPGIGYNISGKETTQKWDYEHNSVYGGNYDSTINSTANIKKLAFRINFGITEYMYAGYKWRIILTEDFGFLASDLSTTGSLTDPSRTAYSVQDSRPVYVSLLIGILHRSISNHWLTN